MEWKDDRTDRRAWPAPEKSEPTHERFLVLMAELNNSLNHALGLPEKEHAGLEQDQIL